MFNLKKYKFSDIYAMSSGISSKSEQYGHGGPFLSFSTVFNNYFLPDSLNELMNSSERDKKIYSIKKGDIFLTRTSETINELGMSSVAIKDYPNATFSGFVKRLRPISENITYDKYIGFYLRSKFFRKTMTCNAVMTLRASLNEEIFSYLHLYLPEYNEQKKIGDFLFNLNSKISNNQKINNELEAIAKTIYNYWFVQFDFPDKNGNPYKSSGGEMIWSKELSKHVPKDWNIDKMNGRVKIGSGYPFDSSSYFENGTYKIITIKNVQEMNLDSRNSVCINDIPENTPDYCKLALGDILISLTGNVGRTCLVSESNLLLNQRVGKILCDKIYMNYLYLYFQRKEVKTQLENISTGSSQKNLSPVDVVNSYILFPPETVLNSYNVCIDKIIKKIILNNQENKTLISIREDTLPMLMNGQIMICEKNHEK